MTNQKMLIAHIRNSPSAEQSLRCHCRNVAELCRNADAAKPFPSLSYLIGLLHDMGKCTLSFQEYLRWAAEHPNERQEHQNHAATGAIFCRKRWETADALTAQIIALCICGHHTGLSDCIRLDGTSEYLQKTEDNGNLNYNEAVGSFISQIAPLAELDELFEHARQEVSEWMTKKPSAFDAGVLVRLLFGILVDADRWDTACFEYGEDPFAGTPAPDFDSVIERFETYINTTFDTVTELDKTRAMISDICLRHAEDDKQIFSLSVPTGGGKTFASLRFALHHAKKHGLKRIFYIIPYNTILDQNAADIETALGDSVSVLVHHSNVVQDNEEDEISYARLTERWDSTIVLTSLVQFLNALYIGKNGSARRMPRLTDAVLIFDEIQSLPKHCKVLFEKAITFLKNHCRCTVVLCTATQPKLDVDTAELMQNTEALYRQLQRVHYIPELSPEISNRDAASKIVTILNGGESVLSVVNVKKTAWEIYQASCELLREDGWNVICPADNTANEPTECGPHDILCVHLSTFMCPAHRMRCIEAVKAWTKAKKPTLCVSTALIEAGINVSFPVVIRSLAGLPSVIQAGGRCNRNSESAYGKVYIWSLYEEKEALTHLKDIQNGGNSLLSMLDTQYHGKPDELSMPEAVDAYFERIQSYTEKESRFPYEKTDLVSMLSGNKYCSMAAKNRSDATPASLPLKQSFRTVGEAFRVIDEDTVGILVPYGKGRELIAELCAVHDLSTQKRLLRQAQIYSVNIYRTIFKRLADEGALYPVGTAGALALRRQYYDKACGVSITPTEMDMLIF